MLPLEVECLPIGLPPPMLRRAKSIDIPFMVKGYEIGLRDGNFSESKMQINAFFANTTTHKNVHSYIFEMNNTAAGYAILRKKDDGRHEIMMMFVDPAQQGQGVGRKFLEQILLGPMKDSPVICSTTQPASTRMMKLLKGLGFERKLEAADGVYWEKRSGAAAPAAAKTSTAAAPLTGSGRTRPVLALPLILPSEPSAMDAEALEAATTAYPLPPPTALPPKEPIILEGAVEELEPATEPSFTEPALPDPPPPEELPEALTIPVDPAEVAPDPPAPLPPATPPAPAAEPSASPGADEVKLPKPPPDFSGRATKIGYASKRDQARQLARELFATLKAPAAEPPPARTESTDLALTVPSPTTEEEDIPLLATLTIVREKLGSLPGVSLPPLDRYGLMEFNKKDLENMNVVELAALSAQLIRLAKEQLAEIDKLKLEVQKKRR